MMNDKVARVFEVVVGDVFGSSRTVVLRTTDEAAARSYFASLRDNPNGPDFVGITDGSRRV